MGSTSPVACGKARLAAGSYLCTPRAGDRRRRRGDARPRRLGRPGDDLSDLFLALGEAAAEHETGIVFLLDEVQFLDRPELEAPIAALHQVSQHQLPLTLAGAGLPQLPALTGAAKSYAERLFRFPTIDRLDEQAARDALELPARAEGVEFERAATDRIVALTEGYPYFLQEYGKHVWNVATGPTISASDVERAHDLTAPIVVNVRQRTPGRDGGVGVWELPHVRTIARTSVDCSARSIMTAAT